MTVNIGHFWGENLSIQDTIQMCTLFFASFVYCVALFFYMQLWVHFSCLEYTHTDTSASYKRWDVNMLPIIPSHTYSYPI